MRNRSVFIMEGPLGIFLMYWFPSKLLSYLVLYLAYLLAGSLSKMACCICSLFLLM